MKMSLTRPDCHPERSEGSALCFDSSKPRTSRFFVAALLRMTLQQDRIATRATPYFRKRARRSPSSFLPRDAGEDEGGGVNFVSFVVQFVFRFRYDSAALNSFDLSVLCGGAHRAHDIDVARAHAEIATQTDAYFLVG